ncbi:MAG: phosphoribosylamine--glycine ligase [Candidatus Gygaella obscura]|nr:phosphoribosylamine--glycine ligase [Candidatus Gygaella obscura]
MKVLVIGSGAREHALIYKIAQSKSVEKIFAAPGNGGIAGLAECVEIKADDVANLLEFAKKEKIDFTVVGPEAALAKGIVNEFNKNNLLIFGVTKEAAMLESSKIFSKRIMQKYNIPTADFEVFDNSVKAKEYLKEKKFPCVIKADGLAAGKGVVIVKDYNQAAEAVDRIMNDKIFGDAGNKILIEDFLVGQEVSIIVVTDSKDIAILDSSQDYKRVFDNDEGSNTGGMGAYSPVSLIDKILFDKIIDQIIKPTVAGLVEEGIEYKGVLYAGVMVTSAGPKVLEFNVRFGDPETQVILPRINFDFLELLLSTSKSNLGEFLKKTSLTWDERFCVCVVCVSGGYPGNYDKGKPIEGLEETANLKDIIVFHAGTKKIVSNKKDNYITDGGRVLSVTGFGKTINLAIENVYNALKGINFENMHYRKDIAKKAII